MSNEVILSQRFLALINHDNKNVCSRRVLCHDFQSYVFKIDLAYALFQSFL